MQAELVEPDHVALAHRRELVLGHRVVLAEIIGVVVELLRQRAVANHVAGNDVERAGQVAHLGRERMQDLLGARHG